MKDFRLPENRLEYFSRLYRLNLAHGVMPGLVYLYMPALAERYGWDDEQRLWFAFLNGLTQNPITSLRIFEQLPVVPPAGAGLSLLRDWFDDNWEHLQFDTDRRYQKKDTIDAIKVYALLVEEHGSQVTMLSDKPYQQLWKLVREKYLSFGRLSTFSYLEYVYLNGFGADCADLLFEDKSGSKSHRNGMLFLMGRDDLVWDKRQPNGHTGEYENFKKMCAWLAVQAEQYLVDFAYFNIDLPHVGKFTLESNLCTFKNHFFARRYPGVYADMAWERIVWAEAHGANCDVFKEIRAERLPEWLRAECEKERLPLRAKAAIFAETGVPYRAENFITESEHEKSNS